VNNNRRHTQTQITHYNVALISEGSIPDKNNVYTNVIDVFEHYDDKDCFVEHKEQELIIQLLFDNIRVNLN